MEGMGQRDGVSGLRRRKVDEEASWRHIEGRQIKEVDRER